MKTLLLLLLLPFPVFAQMAELKTYSFSNGLKFSKGDSIILGKPSGNNVYNHVYYYKGVGKRKEPLPEQYKGAYEIKKIQRHGAGDDSKIIFIADGTDKDKYGCDIADAVLSGEVVVEERFRKTLKHKFDLNDIPLKNGLPYYEEIVEIGPQYSKEQLFKAAKLTLIKSFKDAKEVIQNEDAAEGNIIAKGASEFSYDTKVRNTGMYQECLMYFIVEISVKDGKYRIRLYDYSAETVYAAVGTFIRRERIPESISARYDAAQKGERPSLDFLEAFHAANKGTLAGFSLLMMKATVEKSEDDW